MAQVPEKNSGNKLLCYLPLFFRRVTLLTTEFYEHLVPAVFSRLNLSGEWRYSFITIHHQHMLCYSSQDKVKNACSDHYQHKHWLQKSSIPVGSGLFMVCNGTPKEEALQPASRSVPFWKWKLVCQVNCDVPAVSATIVQEIFQHHPSYSS